MTLVPHFFTLPHKDQEEILLSIEEYQKQAHIGIHACAQNDPMGLRDWGHENWIALMKLLIAKHYTPLWIGSKADNDYYRVIWDALSPYEQSHILDYVGETAFAEVPALLKNRTRALICVNSSIMHLAVMARHPVVAVVGGTPAKIVLPDEPNIRYIQDPALEWWEPKRTESIRFGRLKEVAPERVMEKLEELMGIYFKRNYPEGK